MKSLHHVLREPDAAVGDRTALVWPVAVTLSFAVALLRVNPTVEELHPYVWLALLFLPLAVATAVMLVTEPPGRDPRMRWVALAAAALTVVCGLSTLWSVTPFRSASQSALMAVSWLFLYVTATRRWRDGVRCEDLLLLFWLVAGAVVLGVVLRVAGVYSTVGVGRRLQGVLGNPNYLGMALTSMVVLGAVLLVRGLSRRQVLAVAIAGGVGVVAIVWSGSRGSLGAVGVGFLIAIWSTDLRRAIAARWKIVVAGTLAGAALCATGWAVAPHLEPPATTTAHMQGQLSESDSVENLLDRGSVESGITTGRAAIWKETLRVSAERPVQGYGYRSSEAASDGNLTTHNLVLSYLLETGAVGALLFVLLVLALLRAGWTRHPARLVMFAGCAAIAVQEQVEASLQSFSGPTSMMQWLVIFAFAASGAAARRHHVQDDPRSPA